jgi:hypothetical protein
MDRTLGTSWRRCAGDRLRCCRDVPHSRSTRVRSARGSRSRRRAADTCPATFRTVAVGSCGPRVGRLWVVYALGGALPVHKHGQGSVVLASVWNRDQRSWVPIIPRP